MAELSMTHGYLALVLHAHLPYVRHPEHERFLEEDWYYEAVTETYLPLLGSLAAMAEDGVDFRLTMSLTPTLAGMMSDQLLRARCQRHLHLLSRLVDQELDRTRSDPPLSAVARHYREQIDRVLATWQRHDGWLLPAFRQHQERGNLEIMTCAATHAYLPLMQLHPQAVRAQLRVAVDDYQRHFGRPPRGIWLPECGYYPGLDEVLCQVGLRYFITDAQGLLFADPRPRHGNYAPIFCAGSGVAAFGRDLESSLEVWSKQQGYPGDPEYREFYRDIGYDLDHGYLAPYLQATGERKNTGVKYHRITGPVSLGEKALYDPGRARDRVAIHARDFVDKRQRQIERLGALLGRPPIVVSPYDAELFGHWWYEGPGWLETVLRRAAWGSGSGSGSSNGSASGCGGGSGGDSGSESGDGSGSGVMRLTHLGEYLSENPTQQVARPAQSSWGDKGYHEFWLNQANEWIYPHLHKAEERMIELCSGGGPGAGDPGGAETAAAAPRESGMVAGNLVERALNQAARELLLAQSSDWAFIMRAGTMVDYAVRRTHTHLQRFLRLYQQIRTGLVDEEWLRSLECVDNIFPGIDHRVYRQDRPQGELTRA